MGMQILAVLLVSTQILPVQAQEKADVDRFTSVCKFNVIADSACSACQTSVACTDPSQHERFGRQPIERVPMPLPQGSTRPTRQNVIAAAQSVVALVPESANTFTTGGH